MIATAVWVFPASESYAQFDIQFVRTIGETDRAQTDTIKNVLLIDNDRMALTCGLDGCVCLWDISQKKIVRRFTHEDFKAVYCMAVIKDGAELICAGAGPGIIRFDLQTGEILQEYPHSESIYCMDVFPDEKKFLAGDSNGNVNEFLLEQEKPVRSYRESSEDITALKILESADVFVTGNGDGKVHLWELNKEKPQHEFQGLENWTCCLRDSTDGTLMFGSDYSGNVALWDLETKSQRWLKKEISNDICWGHFLDDEKIVAVDTEDSYFLIDQEDGAVDSRSIVLPAAAGFALSTDKKTIWAGGTNMLCGWNIESAKRVFPDDAAMRFVKGIGSLALHEGRIYVAAGGAPIAVWEALTGKNLGAIELDKKQSDWDGCVLHTIQAGLVVTTEQVVAMFDYEDGFAPGMFKKIESEHMARSPVENHLTFVARNEPRQLKTVDLTSGKRSNVLTVPENQYISDFVYIDETHIAMIVDTYPCVAQIWSLRDKKAISVYSDEKRLEFLGFGEGLLLANQGDNLVGFSKRVLPETESGKRTVKQLVNDLGSEDFLIRQKAVNALLAGEQSTKDQLNGMQVSSLEARIQLRKIRMQMHVESLPNFNRHIDATKALTGDLDAVCIDPAGRFFVVAQRKGWGSELLICNHDGKSWTTANRMELRSRVSAIAADESNPGLFAIGFSDGTLDVIQIEN